MTNGAVTCRVRLDRGGYVPGEAISIWATITNSSRVTIKHTRASLTEVCFHLLFFYKIWYFFAILATIVTLVFLAFSCHLGDHH